MMTERNRKPRLIYNVALLAICIGSPVEVLPAHAAPAGRPSCGDYSILSEARVREILQRHCGTNRAEDHDALLASLHGIDPVTEAHAAAQRGDFRLAAIVGGGPYQIEKSRSWEVKGITCRSLEDGDVLIWLRVSDVYDNLKQPQFEYQMRSFAYAYNRALLEEYGFPTKRGCQ